MLSRPVRAEIGPYSLLLPGDAVFAATTTRSPPAACQIAHTSWNIALGRFLLMIHLDSRRGVGDLKSFIDQQTKGSVHPLPVVVNGIDGETYGDYRPPRTWIDWWFKRGDTMICLNLQSLSFPTAEPTAAEAAEHLEIVGSLRYIPDALDEVAPRPAS